MTNAELTVKYRAYIACLNRQDWGELGRYVAEDAEHNGRRFGLAGYRAMLEQDFRDIPDLRFNIALLLVEAPHVAARLLFDCSPKGDFLGLPLAQTLQWELGFGASCHLRIGEGGVAATRLGWWNRTVA